MKIEIDFRNMDHKVLYALTNSAGIEIIIYHDGEVGIENAYANQEIYLTIDQLRQLADAAEKLQKQHDQNPD